MNYNYVVEQEGYNDGLPYVASRHLTLEAGLRNLAAHREENSKVRYRLIHIIEDYS